MQIIELLVKIRQVWIDRISHRLARGEGVRESFIHELSQFYDLLQQAIVTGDPAWLDPLLDAWVDARTKSELEKQETSLSPILNQIVLTTYEVVSENIAEKDALEIFGAVLPVYVYALDRTAQREAQLHIEHISNELDNVRLTLERLDKSKSDFIAVAAHELKTPLTLIEGYSTMLRDQFPIIDQSSQSIILISGIKNGTRRLREIIDDMIDVSLIDNDMMSLNFQPVWINQLLTLAEQELTETVNTRSQTLEINSFPGYDEMTFGDPERLYQGLKNILTNAIKYTPDGGTITVDGRKLPGFIEITVKDTGIGIDVADLERIFEKFGRIGDASLHSSGKTKFKGGGPGLGLPITKGIIDAHGGAIWVESDGYDEITCPGSTFHVLLPIIKESPDFRTAKLFRPLANLPKEENNDELISEEQPEKGNPTDLDA